MRWMQSTLFVHDFVTTLMPFRFRVQVGLESPTGFQEKSTNHLSRPKLFCGEKRRTMETTLKDRDGRQFTERVLL